MRAAAIGGCKTETKLNKQQEDVKEVVELTGDVNAALECFRYFAVHLDQKFLFLSKLLVAAADFVIYPRSEGLPNNGVGDVHQPLSRNLVHISIFGQIKVDLRALASCLEDARDTQVLILRDVKNLNFVALYAIVGVITRSCTYNFLLPITRSLRKYIVKLSQAQRYALTSTVKNT